MMSAFPSIGEFNSQRSQREIVTAFSPSFDVRGKSMKDATTWSDPSVFGTRAKFNLERDLNSNMDPAFLEIDVS
jgi:hypothetical protein